MQLLDSLNDTEMKGLPPQCDSAYGLPDPGSLYDSTIEEITPH